MTIADEKKSRTGYLVGADGGKSSKRLCGCVLCGIGCVMAIILFVFSLWHTVVDSKTAFDVMCSVFATGGSLLGFGTLFERINNK
jgi:hypothetical protein